MSIDLSAVSDDFLTLILLRVPAKDLIGKCTQVSPQWNRILLENYFWRQKMEQDGYVLEWPKLANLSIKSFKWMALKHCFKRNFIKDEWNLDLQNESILTLDSRWVADQIVWQKEDNINGEFARIEIPPVFLDGPPEIPPGYANPIAACVATGYESFTKKIVIKLSDEGLTDEIMDNFRPTILVTELVGNRRDCASGYEIFASLEMTNEDEENNNSNKNKIACRRTYFRDSKEGEYRRVSKHETWVSETAWLRFGQWQAEGWHRLEITFKDYPAGMRYLSLYCNGHDCQGWAGHYGVKLADCSVKALCEKNAE